MLGSVTSQTSSAGAMRPSFEGRPPPPTDATSASGATSPSAAMAADLMSAVDGDGSGDITSQELQSFVDSLDDTTRSALLSLQEDLAGSTDTTTEDDSTSATTADVVSTLMSALDTDGDGSITESEASSWMEANAPPPPPPGGPGGPPPTDTASASDDTTTATTTITSTSGDTTTTDGTTSTGGFDAATLMAQLLAQSYGRLQSSMTSTLVSSLDTAA